MSSYSSSPYFSSSLASDGDLHLMSHSHNSNHGALSDMDWQEETKNLIVKHIENKHCADCLATETEWASINLGIFVCINCSGVHRSLGTHVSKVRSITLDQTVWNREIYNLMNSRGNHISNSYWECNALPFEKPLAQDPYHYRQRYIENKYANKKFVASPSNISYKLERDFSIDLVNARGMITKQGGTRKNWRRRYAVLNGNILNYFVDEHDSYPKGSLELMHDHMIVFVDEDDARITAGGTGPNRKNCFAIVTKQRNYYICCEQEEQAAKWVYALRAAVYFTNLRDVLNDPRNFLKGGESKSVEKVGFLKKQGGGWASIKKRYFRLKNNKLAYYKSEKELEPIDEIDLKGVKISNISQNSKDKKLQFSIMLSTNTRQYFFYAENAVEQKSWIDALQAVANTVSDLQLVQAKSSAIHNLILNRMIHGKDRKDDKSIITPHSPMMWKTISFHRCKPMDSTFLARIEECYGTSIGHAERANDTSTSSSRSNSLCSPLSPIDNYSSSPLMSSSPALTETMRARKVSLRMSVEHSANMRPQSLSASSPDLSPNIRNSMPSIPSNVLKKQTFVGGENFVVQEEFSKVQLSNKNRLLPKKNKDEDPVIIMSSRLLPHSKEEDSDDDDLEDLNALISDSLKVAQMGTNTSSSEDQSPKKIEVVATEDEEYESDVDLDSDKQDMREESLSDEEEIEIKAIPLRKPYSPDNSLSKAVIEQVDIQSEDDQSNDYEEEEPVLILNSPEPEPEEEPEEPEEDSSDDLGSSDDEYDEDDDAEPEIIMGQFTTEDISATAFPDMDQPIVRKASVLIPSMNLTCNKKPKGMTSFRKMHTFMQPTLQDCGVPVLD